MLLFGLDGGGFVDWPAGRNHKGTLRFTGLAQPGFLLFRVGLPAGSNSSGIRLPLVSCRRFSSLARPGFLLCRVDLPAGFELVALAIAGLWCTAAAAVDVTAKRPAAAALMLLLLQWLLVAAVTATI